MILEIIIQLPTELLARANFSFFVWWAPSATLDKIAVCLTLHCWRHLIRGITWFGGTNLSLISMPRHFAAFAQPKAVLWLIMPCGLMLMLHVPSFGGTEVIFFISLSLLKYRNGNYINLCMGRIICIIFFHKSND